MKLFRIVIIAMLVCGTASAQQQQSQRQQQNAQQNIITGTVLDENGQPLPGVIVTVKGTSTGTLTMPNGSYRINAEPDRILLFTLFGYADQEHTVGRQRKMDVDMKPTAQQLDDLVVVGYGSVRKSDLTGSVSTVKGDVFEQSAGASFQNALAGKVAGMQVIQNSGVPGGETTIRIRGSNSMGSSGPLYIIDGVPYDNSSVAGFESDGASISPLSMFNPSEIESMEVLKDASATAIYGSRASNGVVIITTKSARSGRSQITADFDYGVMELYKRVDVLDANQYWILRNEALLNAGRAGVPASTLALAERGMVPSFDWQDILFRTGRTANASLAISGVSDKIRYRMSLNGYTADGIVPKTDFGRLSGLLKLDGQVTSRLKVGTNINISSIKTSGLPTATNLLGGNNGTNSIVSRALRTRSTLDPSLGWASEYDPSSPNEGIEDYSPLMLISSVTQQNTALQTLAGVYAEYELAKGLKFKVTADYNARNEESRYYQNGNLPYGFSEGGWARTMDRKRNSFTNENFFTYDGKFNHCHSLNAVAGFSVQMTDNETISTSTKGFPNHYLEWHDLSAGINQEPTTISESGTRLVSWYGRANYNLKDRYLITFTGRVDGSSKFAEGHKYAFFPAGALAWRVSEESWMKDAKDLVSNLKLRLSYGHTGNQALSPYASLGMMNSLKVIFGNTLGANNEHIGYTFPTRMPNPGLGWEKTAQTDAGIDLMMFKGRLEIVADYYVKNTTGLLVTTAAAPSTGYATVLRNFGEMRNRGFELNITGYPVNLKKFQWNSSFNISFNRTVITDLYEDYTTSGMSVPWNGFSTQILIKGQELGTFWGYKRDGIRQSGEPDPGYTIFNNAVGEGDQKYVNLNGDEVINENDKTVIGRAQPDFTFGFNNSFQYRNFSLSIFIDGSYGNDICDMNSMQGLRFGQDHGFAEMMKRWTPDNPTNEYPRVLSTNTNANFAFSDAFIFDGSFLRIQNITLRYELPRKWSSAIKVSSIRVFASVQNVHTFTRYKGLSPDVSIAGANNLQMGHDNGSYPNPTVYRAGVNLKF